MTSAELLRLVRRRNGLTQAQLARAAGTSQPVISAYEHGRREPSVSMLARLVDAAGERLELGATMIPNTDLPPSADDGERSSRLLDVLSLADAIPHRRRPAVLDGPRMVSL
jgi:transcriptional regulator with XRE-family HTH domain